MVIPKTYAKDFEQYLKIMNEAYKNEYLVTDPDVEVCFESATMPKKVLDELLQVDLMNCLYACPHGVLAMSQNIKDFVETSTNLASVKIEGEKIIVTTQVEITRPKHLGRGRRKPMAEQCINTHQINI